jgi:hypothetical protein
MANKYGLWLYIRYDDEPIPTSLVVMEDPKNRQWSAWWQRPISAGIPYQGIWWPGDSLGGYYRDIWYFYPRGADAKPGTADALFVLDNQSGSAFRRTGRFINPPFTVADTKFEWTVYLHEVPWGQQDWSVPR